MKSKITMTLAILMIALFSSSAMAVGSFEILEFGDSFFPAGMSINFDGSAVAGWGSQYWSPETGYVVLSEGQVGQVTGSGQQIIGTATNPADGLQWAAVYDVPTGVWTLMDLLPGGEGCSDWGTGYAGNFDGTMATGLAWIPNCRAEAFKWVQGVGTVGLGRLDDRSSRGTDMSDDGSMVVGFAENPTGGFRQMAYWTDDVVGPQVLGDGDPGELYAVDSYGTSACGIWNSQQVYWDPVNGLVPIGTLPGEFEGSAFDISDDGKVVGEAGNPFFGAITATIWTVEDGLMPIADYFATFDVPTPEGFIYSRCTGVSADGQTFVGAGVQDGGFFYSPWLVRLDASVVPAFFTHFDVEISNGNVNLSFDVNGEVTASDFEMVAELDGRQWTVPVIQQGSSFVADDDSPELRNGGTVTYSLYFREEDGSRSLISSKSVDLSQIPELVSGLKGAFPNPFNPMTKVAFSLAHEGHVELFVYDLSGRRVAELANRVYGAGDHTVTWYGKDDSGRALASGTYFVQMRSGELLQQTKVNLVK
jgi:hypothetical protein